MQGAHGSDLSTLRCNHIEADQAGVIVGIVLVDLGKPCARNVKLEIAQSFGCVAVTDSGDADDEMVFRRTHGLDLETLSSVLSFQRTVSCDCRGMLRERPGLPFAAHARRGADTGNANSFGHGAS